ncbi:uncharacterized protein LOC120332565 [Styela clava]
MANSSSDSIGSFSAEKMDQKTKDIFNGKALIDRLLVYFSKFEGSRDKAKRYAQKLLDLGHIESLAQSLTFEDSSQEYRWTDVASVVNKAKAKVAAQDVSNNSIVNGEGNEPESRNAKPRRPTLRISIEADNCDGAEIQAHIRTNPTKNSMTRSSTKSGDTICFSGVQNGKMISFVTETSKTEEVLRMVPVSTVINEEDLSQNSNSKSIKSNSEQQNDFRSKDQHCKNLKTKLNPGIKEYNYNSSESDSAVEVDNSSTIEQTTSIDNSSTPGKGVTSLSTITFDEKVTQNGVEHTRKFETSDVERNLMSEPSGKIKSNLHKYKWEKQSTKISDQREETVSDSIKKYESKKILIPHNSTPHPGGQNCDNKKVNENRQSLSSISSLSDSEKNYPSPEGSPPLQTKKMQFKGDSEWIKLRREYLEHSEIREMTELKNGETTVYNDTGISLHAVNEDVREEESEDIMKDSNLSNVENLVIPAQPIIPISPPPSTPTSPRKSPSDLGIKSLFWTKLVCDSTQPDEAEGIFWSNVEKRHRFDEEDFVKLFSKPAPSPIHKTSRTRITQQQEQELAEGKALKVLSTERSRQVGIRASSIRLPVEDIHDAVLNMDDSALDLDALEALYDVRPTSDELDDFSDALKKFPNGVLDKPEQFVLMLAMLGNLDERLKSWIFAKKFPDKILDIKDQLNAMSNACIQIVRNSTLQKLLEAVLMLGNIMNKGTQRGNADGYLLDILPKLKDVKSQGGDINLTLYLVRWIISEQEKSNSDFIKRQDSKASALTDDGEANDCHLPGQTVLQKACSVSIQDVLEDIECISAELTECKDQLIPAVIEGATCIAEIKPFNDRMTDFIGQAEKALSELQTLAAETSDIAEEFKLYYVPTENTKTESIGNMLKHINSFCEDFRMYWNEEKRNAAKEVFFNTEKARRQRIAAIKIAKSPSALKARFLEKRKRDGTKEQNENNELLKPSENSQKQRPPGRREFRNDGHGQRQDTPLHRSANWKNSSTKQVHEDLICSQSTSGRRLQGVSRSNNQVSTPSSRVQKPVERANVANGHASYEAAYKPVTPTTSAIRPARKTGPNTGNTPVAMSRMKQAMTKRRLLLKSKTC